MKHGNSAFNFQEYNQGFKLAQIKEAPHCISSAPAGAFLLTHLSWISFFLKHLPAILPLRSRQPLNYPAINFTDQEQLWGSVTASTFH